MSKLHIGPHTDLPHDDHANKRFDREISLRGVFWTIGGLVIVALVTHVLMWYLLKGIGHMEKKQDPPPLPLAAANTQAPPPEPRLQTSPEVELQSMRAEEDQALTRSSWVDQAQGTVRVPIDVAMDVIASRGLGAEVVGGQPGTNPATTPPAQQTVAPGATLQMTRPPGGAEPQAAEITSSQGQGAQASPPPPERR
ncbi:MAG TPA: hypothetical protein VEL74_06795 [Thermoanaerobaculia bacterium]|nr:hypothetical protein [Thermoanaerobaculia bacterium]